jgi:hypothetical protein
MKHKHAEVIKAWVDGAEIEAFDHHIKKWFVVKHPIWESDMEYRVKPTPKPDIVLYTRISNCGVAYFDKYKNINAGHNLKVTICGNYGWLIAAEVIE